MFEWQNLLGSTPLNPFLEEILKQSLEKSEKEIFSGHHHRDWRFWMYPEKSWFTAQNK